MIKKRGDERSYSKETEYYKGAEYTIATKETGSIPSNVNSLYY